MVTSHSLDELKFHLGGMLACPPKTKDDDGKEITDYEQLTKDIIELFEAYYNRILSNLP